MKRDYRKFFIYLPTESLIYRTLLFDHIRNDKCPNDSKRIMPFVASVPFWFLVGKCALENSSIVCRVPF